MTPLAPEGEALTALVLLVFRLNGLFLGAAERLSAPAGLTAARWQVLASVFHEPDSVAGIARDIGLARQSVQRLADILAAEGLATYRPNPAHRRAKLLTITEAGREAIARLAEDQHRWANRVAATFTAEDLRTCVGTAQRLASVLEDEERSQERVTCESEHGPR